MIRAYPHVLLLIFKETQQMEMGKHAHSLVLSGNICLPMDHAFRNVLLLLLQEKSLLAAFALPLALSGNIFMPMEAA